MVLTTLFSGDSLSSRGMSNAGGEGDYDVLPIRKSMILIIL